ncbi:hypothetical protein GCM10009626_09560 [Brachybacterium sacelli]
MPSMPSILHLVQRPTTGGEDTPRLAVRDVYDLDRIDLDAYAGLVLASGCDQRFLRRHRQHLSDWVRSGGRLLFSGHALEPFVDGLPKHRKLEFHATSDLWLTEQGSHPIWDGVDRRELLYRTGVPGPHTFEDLQRLGVAGFYARSYLVDLPQDAVVITGIGPGHLPVDVSYPLGAGEVILHTGNDLISYTQPGADLAERALAHLELAPILAEVA